MYKRFKARIHYQATPEVRATKQEEARKYSQASLNHIQPSNYSVFLVVRDPLEETSSEDQFEPSIPQLQEEQMGLPGPVHSFSPLSHRSFLSSTHTSHPGFFSHLSLSFHIAGRKNFPWQITHIQWCLA